MGWKAGEDGRLGHSDAPYVTTSHHSWLPEAAMSGAFGTPAAGASDSRMASAQCAQPRDLKLRTGDKGTPQ